MPKEALAEQVQPANGRRWELDVTKQKTIWTIPWFDRTLMRKPKQWDEVWSVAFWCDVMLHPGFFSPRS